MRLSWLLTALLLAALMLGLHVFALETYFYWQYLWFDIPMHILGGAALAAFIIALIGRRRPLLLFLGMLAVVVGWEVFEYIAKIPADAEGYLHDTAFDIVNGLVGASILYAIARVQLKREVRRGKDI